MPGQPLCEVFGYPVNDQSPEAIRHRSGKLCPFNNVVPQCTKTSVLDPLGVCSVFEKGAPVITCPVRFRQKIRNATMYDDAKKFLLPSSSQWDYVTEATLRDSQGLSVGDIDVVLVEYESNNKVTDFGIMEVQAVYISGNIRNPFNAFLAQTEPRRALEWTGLNYPRPDWLSSIKRLVRQLTVKGAIFNTWQKRMAVACQRQFFTNLRLLDNAPIITEEESELAWLLYDLHSNEQTGYYELQLERTVYMTFEFAMDRLSSLQAGDIQDFVAILNNKLAEKRKSNR